MANVWGTLKDAGQWVVMEAMELLESKRNVSQYFDTSYSREFELAFPVSDSIKIPYPMQYGIRNGLTYNPPDKAQRYSTVSIGEPFGVDLPEIDSIEAALSSPRARAKFSQEIIDPAVSRIRTEYDRRAALYAYVHAAGVVGALGTNPTTFDATSAAAREYMQNLAAPEGDRGLLVPPSVMRAIKGANAGLFNPVTDISKMFREGIVGYSDGFEWGESNNLFRHTAGTFAAAVTVTTTSVDGATTLAVTCTSGDIFKQGDKFSIGSVYPVNPEHKGTFGTNLKTFTITGASQTISGTSATITFSPAVYGPLSPFQNVDALPVAAAALTLWPGTTSPNAKVGTVGLAIPKRSFAMVGVKLEKFTDVEMCNFQRDPDSGMSIRFTAGSDIRNSKRIRRFDTCIGFGELYNDNACVVACG